MNLCTRPTVTDSAQERKEEFQRSLEVQRPCCGAVMNSVFKSTFPARVSLSHLLLLPHTRLETAEITKFHLQIVLMSH